MAGAAVCAFLYICSGNYPASVLLALTIGMVSQSLFSRRVAVTTALFCFLMWIPAYLTQVNFHPFFLLAGAVSAMTAATGILPEKAQRLLLVAKGWLLATAGTILVYHSCALPIMFSPKQPNRAFWIQSRWGVPIEHTGELNIRAQYSYDIVVKWLSAATISDTAGIGKYDEIWMITPTTALPAAEIQRIRDWVAKGGHLVLISDHTNLFGHADVINPLLESMSAGSICKDVILEQDSSGGWFWTICSGLAGLSANSLKTTGEPWLAEWGYSERADYSARSFFSDNEISDEEAHGLFVVGSNTPYGRGHITCMGDSTSLANFALARPSAQTLLKHVSGSGTGFSLFFTEGIALLLLCLAGKKGVMLTRGVLLIPLAALSMYITSRRGGQLHYNSIPTCRVEGDWQLAESEDGALSGIFPSAFSLTACFPVWHGSDTHDGQLRIGNRKFKPVKDKGTFHCPSLLPELLETRQPSRDLNAILELMRHNMAGFSFWYDDGVGPVKHDFFSRIWAEMGIGKHQPRTLSCRQGEEKHFICTPQGKASFHAACTISPIDNAEGWVIVGAYLIGRELDNHSILILTTWQAPGILGQDLVLTPDEGKHNQYKLP